MHVEPNLSKQLVPTVVSAYTQGSHNVDILNPLFLRNIDETSWRSLSGVHANKCILRLLPNMEVFKSLLRCVKLWAKRRGVYGNLLVFFGGVHLAILAAFICQRHPNVLHQDETPLLYRVFSLSSTSMVLCLVMEICYQVSLLLLMKCLSLREGHLHLLFLVRVSLNHLMHLLQRIMALFR